KLAVIALRNVYPGGVRPACGCVPCTSDLPEMDIRPLKPKRLLQGSSTVSEVGRDREIANAKVRSGRRETGYRAIKPAAGEPATLVIITQTSPARPSASGTVAAVTCALPTRCISYCRCNQTSSDTEERKPQIQPPEVQRGACEHRRAKDNIFRRH